MSARIASALAAALLLLGCGGQGADTAAPPSPTASAPGSATAEPSPTLATPAPTATAEPDDPVVLDASCDIASDDPIPLVTLQHPAGWHVSGDDINACEFFDPGDPELEPGTEADAVDVRWSIEPVAFSTITASDIATDEQRRLVGVVDGHRAVRTTATSTGEAALPEGIETTTWVVDLSRSAQGEDASLVGTARDVDAVDYDDAVRVLDAMARQVRIGPATPTEDVTVMRWQGTRGFVVAYRAEDGCLELFAGSRQGARLDRACDLEPGEPLTATILRGDDLAVAAGIAGSEVDAVRLRANTDAMRAVVTTQIGDAERAFALPLSGTEAALVAETFGGEELGTVAVLPE